mgnify:CR=1 FL=1
MRSMVGYLRGWARRVLADVRIRAHQPYASLRPVPLCENWPDGGEGTGDFAPMRAWELLEQQCSAGPRCPGGPGREPTLRLILDRLTRTAGEVAVQEWPQPVERGVGAGRSWELTNVLARFGPAGEAPGLLLATHWDTRPAADEDPDAGLRGTPPVGANDGASGVAVLLELARTLRVRRPGRPVVLAFLDGEDLGEHCYGGRQLARALRRRDGRRWRTRRAVVIDMIGGAGLRCTTERHSMRSAPALWHELHAHAAALGLDRHFGGPAARITDDHVFLARAGVPSVLLIDFTYPYRHTTGDTAERCSPGSLAVIGRVLERLIHTGVGAADLDAARADAGAGER